MLSPEPRSSARAASALGPWGLTFNSNSLAPWTTLLATLWLRGVEPKGVGQLFTPTCAHQTSHAAQVLSCLDRNSGGATRHHHSRPSQAASLSAQASGATPSIPLPPQGPLATAMDFQFPKKLPETTLQLELLQTNSTFLAQLGPLLQVAPRTSLPTSASLPGLMAAQTPHTSLCYWLLHPL